MAQPGETLEWVAVLFARSDSVYKSLPLVDVWDEARDARNYQGLEPVIAHPPCGQWGRLARFAHNVPAQKALAPWAIDVVRRNGGVLEHPSSSGLWNYAAVKRPPLADRFGGWVLPIYQQSFGHRAQKATYLYIVGCAQRDIPALPITLGEATHCIASSSKRRNGMNRHKLGMGKAAREHTPRALAEWLVDLARKCNRNC